MSKAIKKAGRWVDKNVTQPIVKVVKDVAPIAAPLIAVALPGVGTAIGAALGATGTAASALGGAVLGGVGSAIGGKDPLQGALLGGAAGYLGGVTGGIAGTPSSVAAPVVDATYAAGAPVIPGFTATTAPSLLSAPIAAAPVDFTAGLLGEVGPAAGVEVFPLGGTQATVPSAFNTAVNTSLTGTPTVGSFGSVGTGGFGTTIPTAAETAAGLTGAGFAPGTAANLAGLTQAGVGGTPLIPSPTMSLSDVFRTARMASGALSALQPQPVQQPQYGMPDQSGFNPSGVDYSQLLAMLAARARSAGLLGTQFQPRQSNLTGLIG